MPELTDTFTNLKNLYAGIWALTNHSGPDRAALRATFAAPHGCGVEYTATTRVGGTLNETKVVFFQVYIF